MNDFIQRLLLVLSAALAAAGAVRAADPPYDLLLRNARIVDGTGSPWYRADLAVRGDTIARHRPGDSRRLPCGSSTPAGWWLRQASSICTRTPRAESSGPDR
jgi:hypothetical protein